MSLQHKKEVMEKDAERYPHCFHSQSSSKSCTNNEAGKFVCDTLERVMRVCPNKEPAVIFESKKSGEEGIPFPDFFKGLGFGGKQGIEAGAFDDSDSLESFMHNTTKKIDSLRREAMHRDWIRREGQSIQSQGPEGSTTAAPESSYGSFPDEFDNQLNDAMGRSEQSEMYGRTEGPVRKV